MSTSAVASCSQVAWETLETFGLACPQLKHLKLNENVFENENALAGLQSCTALTSLGLYFCRREPDTTDLIDFIYNIDCSLPFRSFAAIPSLPDLVELVIEEKQMPKWELDVKAVHLALVAARQPKLAHMTATSTYIQYSTSRLYNNTAVIYEFPPE